jgi:hypothetical protein
MTNNSGGRSLLGKILFVVGVIIILIVLAFLIIKFVPRMIGGLANVGSSFGSIFGSDEITVSASNTTIGNGERVAVAWEYDTAKAGIYGITFGCTDNVEVDIVNDAGAKSLICGQLFTLGPAAKQAEVRIYLKTENSFADVPVQVYFTESGATTPTASGQVFITIQDGNPSAVSGDLSGDAATIDSEPVTDAATSTKSTTAGTSGGNNVYVNKQTSTYTAPRSVSTGTTYYATGPADLVISNIATSNTQVGFTVSNTGGRASGSWIFSYSTPTNPKETFTSPVQVSLSPGQSIRYTLTFAAKSAGTQSVAIVIDSTNNVTEASEANNIGTVNMTGPAYGNTGGSTGGNTGYDEDDDADFIIEDLEIGRMSGDRFVEDDEPEDGDDIAVRFYVRNRGGETTEDWRFEIRELPYDSEDTFRSKEYKELRPGESIEVILELDNVDEGDYELRVEVDSEDDTDEERENNNVDTIDFEVEN